MSDSSTPTPWSEDTLFGEIVLRNRLIARDQLEEALDLQKQVQGFGARMKLGEILLQRGWIDTRTLDALLRVQGRLHEGLAHPLALRRKGLTPKEDGSIGELAVRNGLIPEEKLAFALRMQERLRSMGFDRRIGEILVHECGLRVEDVENLLQIQKQIGGREDEPTQRLRRAAERKDLAPADLLFGQIAVEHGFVTEPVVEQALEVQRLARDLEVDLSLGEILWEQKHLTDECVAQIAHIQNVKRETFFQISMTRVLARKVDDHSVGDLLVERGVLDPWQVRECLETQAKLGQFGISRPLGEVLLDKGYVSPDLLYSALDEQWVRRANAEALERRRRRVRAAARFALQVVLPVVLGAWTLWAIYEYSYDSTAERMHQAHEAERAARAARLAARGNRTESDPPVFPIPGGLPGSLLERQTSRPITGEDAATRDAILAGERLDREAWDRVVARAARIFSELGPTEFGVSLVGGETEDGLVFEIFGQAPLPDGTPISTELLYYGVPVNLGSKTVRTRSRFFYARTGPMPGRRWAPAGLYTARADFSAQRAGLPLEEIRAAGLPTRMGASDSAYLGTAAADQEFAELLRKFHAGHLARMVDWEREIRAWLESPEDDSAAVTPGDRLQAWDQVLLEIERAWAAYESALLATRYPEADQRMRALLPRARMALQATATATLRGMGEEPPSRLLLPGLNPNEPVIPLEFLPSLHRLLIEAQGCLPPIDGFDPVGEFAARDVARRLGLARRLHREIAHGNRPWVEDGPGRDPDAVRAAGWLLRWSAELQDLRRLDPGLQELLSAHSAEMRYTQVDQLLGTLLELGKLRVAEEAGARLPVEMRPAGTQSRMELETRVESLFAALGG